MQVCAAGSSEFEATDTMRDAFPNANRFRARFERNLFVAIPGAIPASLVTRWRQYAHRIKQYARTVVRHETGLDLAYRVVTGDDIQAHWPELFAFYSDRSLLSWLKEIAGDDMIQTSSHVQSGINLNILDSRKLVYRWHFDAVCYTAILYLTDVRPQDGGSLRVIPKCRQHVVPDLRTAKFCDIWPSAGTIVLMDGTRCYHGVTQLLRPAVRLSIPMVFPNGATSTRPIGLDRYLYHRTA